MDISKFLAEPGKFKSLKGFKTDSTSGVSDKNEANDWMSNYIKDMQELQDKLYADNSHAVLLIFQAMDGAGKDSTIKHVMSGINPQGCQVYNFKQPSAEELDHDFLWRTTRCLPEKGRIGIFNRSYYEEVLIVRVHPELILRQNLPEINDIQKVNNEFWQKRYESINDLEKHLVSNGTTIIKFFLHLSKKEQAERFLKRIEEPEKNWKFAIGDLEERNFWDDYQDAYELMIRETSTNSAPWYIIPADKKWYMRMAVAEVILHRMKQLNLNYPVLNTSQIADLERAKELLYKELD
ncbi:MAG: polyphosphate kinase 2 family protein [Bacteroidales bacterium]|nr:polyphosphate kinase 2 family protein [Bacteroidales bacterium]